MPAEPEPAALFGGGLASGPIATAPTSAGGACAVSPGAVPDEGTRAGPSDGTGAGPGPSGAMGTGGTGTAAGTGNGAVPNDTFGYGQVDVRAAVAAARGGQVLGVTPRRVLVPFAPRAAR